MTIANATDPTSPPGPCPCDCPPGDPGAVPADRNRYFTGKYMTARDFRDEQAYFLSRHRLHDRILHGWGIVCGLDVVPHPDEACRAQGWVIVTPGIALDCFGREVIVREQVPVNVLGLFGEDVPCGCEKQYAAASDPTAASPTDPVPAYPPQPNNYFLIGVKYGELCVEPVPVFADESGCGERTAPNRTRETVCVRYRPFDQKDKCWGPVKPPCGDCPPKSVPDPKCIPATLADVLKPLCDCGDETKLNFGFVPLAKCRFQPDGEQKPPVGVTEIDTTGRRCLPGPLDPCHLTHICKVNWNHGGRMVLDCDELRTYQPGHHDQGQGQQGQQQHSEKHGHLKLVITFDGALDPNFPPTNADHPIEVFPRLFRVCYETETGELRPLPHRGRFELNSERTVLTYTVGLDCLHEVRRHVKHPVIHVTILCDFLTDRWGRAVDGNHLNGSLAWDANGQARAPTGDGVAGGVFESWFQLHW